jgi:glutathione S-transferase
VFWGWYRTPEAQRDAPAVAKAMEQTLKCLRLVDRQLTDRPFMGGQTLSLADIAVGAHLYRYFELEIDRPDLPRLAIWYDRLTERAAYREHVMLPFAELKGRLAF